MQPITFDSTSYLINGRRVYLNSGEFHYFRVPKKDWTRRLRLLKKAGGNAVATYIPWALHEPEEGTFRFSGEPYLELERFLDTAAAEGLYVIARPGPYVYSEIVYDGLPRWLCDGYPALRAHDRAGKDFRRSSISYVHPLFLEKAKRWYDRVCPIIAKHTVSAGGPIAFVQLDNELIGIHTWFGTLDYNRESMGFGRPDGRYPRWLQNRYGTIGALNARYRTAFAAFADVEPPSIPAASGEAGDLLRARDYVEFYLGTVADYGATLADWVRGHGITEPLVHNSGSPPMNPLYRELNGKLKAGGFLLGSDHYYALNQDWPQNSPTPQYALRSFVSLETLRLMGAPPTVFELPGGSGSDWPPIGREDAEAAYFTNLALGMKGHNFYIFTGGPNPPGLGNTDDIYDYGAAVAADGRIRPLYKAQKALGDFLRKHPWFPEARRETDFRVLVDWQAARAAMWAHKSDLLAVGPQDAWEFLRKGLLNSAWCAGLSPEMVDGDRNDWVRDTAMPLAVASSSIMSADLQGKLVAFLRNGGRVLLGPVLPDRDENLEPCTILRDFLGTDGKVEPKPDAAGIHLPFAGNVYVCQSALTMAHPPAVAELLGRDTVNGGCAAWLASPEGNGRLLWLGLQWTHAMRYHSAMVKGALEILGIRPRLTCSNPAIGCALWTHGGRSVLFVMNLFASRQEASITCTPAWSEKSIALPTVTVPPLKVVTVALSADGAPGQ